jgi:hypothetical protein
MGGMRTAVAAAVALIILSTALAMAAAAASEAREEGRATAILGLVGLTPTELRLAAASRAFLTAALASAAGTALGALLTPAILLSVLRGMGLERLPFFADLPAALALCLGVTASAVFAAWVASLFALRSRPRDLVME